MEQKSHTSQDLQIEYMSRAPSHAQGFDSSTLPSGQRIDLVDIQRALPRYHRKFGDATPLGLLAFATTMLVYSLFNIHAAGVQGYGAMLGLAMGFGGITQWTAGVQEWASGNTFGAVVFTTYGSYWLSALPFYVPQFNIAGSFSTPDEYTSAVGLFVLAFAIVTTLFLIAALRSSVAFVTVFVLLDATFFLVAFGFLQDSPAITKAAGVVGIICASSGFYTALAGLLTKETSYFMLPVGDLSRKVVPSGNESV